MVDGKKQPISFDDIIQAGRKQRRHEQLAQDIFGKNRRQSAPAAGNTRNAPLGGSLASRVGVNKQRTASIPRSNSTTPRNGRGPTRPPPMSNNSHRNTNVPSKLAPTQPRVSTFGVKKPAANGGSISIRGAAGGPYVVVASNFAPGTTAADIESVMRNVGGDLLYCRLMSASPTVMAEMGFAELKAADTVIETFNNHRADGRLLHVYYKDSSIAARPVEPPVEEPIPVVEDEVMDVDEAVGAREAENRLREERRGRDDRDRRDVFPSGPRGGGGRGYYEDWQGAGPQPGYNDRRYAYGGPQQGAQGGYGQRDNRVPTGTGAPNGPRYGRGGGGGGNQNWRP